MFVPRGLGASTASSSFAVLNRLAKLSGHLGLAEKTVLDVGCNDGTYTTELAQSAQRVVGIDIESERLGDANRRMKAYADSIGLLMMSVDKLGFPENSFDVVFMNEVLEHIPDQEAALDEIYRVLGDQGTLAVFVPNRFYIVETHGVHIGQRKLGRFIPIIHWLPWFLGKYFMNARSYTPWELKQLLACHGFEVVHMSCLFPPLDGLRNRLDSYNLAIAVDFYRRMITSIERVPLLRSMGLSLFALAVKSKNSPS